MKKKNFLALFILCTSFYMSAQNIQIQSAIPPQLTGCENLKAHKNFGTYIQHLASNPIGFTPILYLNCQVYRLPENVEFNLALDNSASLIINGMDRDGDRHSNPNIPIMLGRNNFRGNCMQPMDCWLLTPSNQGNNDFPYPFSMYLSQPFPSVHWGSNSYQFVRALGINKFLFKGSESINHANGLWLVLSLTKSTIN